MRADGPRSCQAMWGVEEPDHRHRRLLRARGERPNGHAAAAPPRSVMNSRLFIPAKLHSHLPDSLSALIPRGQHRPAAKSLHSITSSAVASSDGGTVRPSIRAVWALMTSSNLLACTTGKSAGFAPLRMRPV